MPIYEQNAKKRPLIWLFKASVISLLVLIPSFSHAQAVTYEQPFTASTTYHAMNSVCPTGNGTVAHTVTYVESFSDTYLYTWMTVKGVGNYQSSAGTFPNEFLTSLACTPLNDAQGNKFYDCNMATSSQYAITNYAACDVSTYLYINLHSGNVLGSSATTSYARDSDGINTGINGNSYNWVGYIDDTTSSFVAPSLFPTSPAVCNPFSTNVLTAFINTSFVLTDCLTYLFLPSSTEMAEVITSVNEDILARAPWGYATRLVTILTNTASSTAPTDLPTFTFTFPDGSPLADDPITINMQEMLDMGSSTLAGVVDPITGKGVKEITEPYILLFIAISALIIMYHDIMGMGRYTNRYADK